MVTGVILSTMELGNVTSCSIHSASSGSRNRAYAVNCRRAMSPLPWMLSQDMTVNGRVPAARRRASASTTRPKTVAGGSASPPWAATRACSRSWATAGFWASNSPVAWLKLYPPSVMVSETMRVAGSVSRAMALSGSAGANT